MVEELKKLHANAYTPITHFAVSAIVKTKDGKIYKGVNVEDASTRAGVCAERNAIYSAIADGVKKGEFEEIHVMVSSGKIGSPCFVCRQMINEVFSRSAKVYCYSTAGEVKVYTVEELCPYPFDESDLN